jgi:hypothetical protein
LELIISDIFSAFGKRTRSQAGHVSRRFKAAVAELCEERNLCIILDEIEWVSPVAVLDTHWHQDFVPFWQTMWTTQSEYRQLNYMIAGVNPTVTEMAEVNGVQNPLFGIISPKFLTGLDESDVRQMLGKFGKRMGMRFEPDAVLYMFKRYGGHPMLTRMAGSYMHNALLSQHVKRPAVITRSMLLADETEREHEIMYYCPHIVSELRKFYPDEYEMLEWLATGNTADFYEFAGDGTQVKHLTSYGLLDPAPAKHPQIEIPVLARYVLAERRRLDKKAVDIYVVPTQSRSRWLLNRLERVAADLRRLDKIGREKDKVPLYGSNGFPEAEKLFAVSVVNSKEMLENFINTSNRCFVEPVERLGKELSKKDYFWNEVKTDYPDLWYALLRIKVYRHDCMHLELTPRVAQQLGSVLESDFGEKAWSSFEDGPFLMQQKVLDGLFLAIMIEIDRLV